MKTVITIDGVVCSGKGTVAQAVAVRLGFLHMSSGEIYRAIGYMAYQRHGEHRDQYTTDHIEKVMEDIDLEIEVHDGRVHYIVHGEDVTPMLSLEICANAASFVAQFPAVRARALGIQHKVAEQHNLVVDGRDTGSHVFPDATLKIFLTAEVEVRARRRTDQLVEKGVEANYEEILQDLQDRDYRDMHREVDPLRPADDAVVIDTTTRTLEDEVTEIVSLLRARQGR